MNKNLYELLDSADADEMDIVMNETAVPLPEGVALDRIKIQVRKKTGLTKKPAFRWQHIAAMAACACIVITAVGGIDMWRNRLPDESDDPSQNQLHQGEATSPSDSNESNTDGDSGNMAEPSPAFTLQSLDALEEMRTMAQLEDGEELEQYLMRIQLGGMIVREDLNEFLDLIDSLPVIQLSDGTVSWIHHYTGSKETTIFIRAENGDQYRITYHGAVSSEADRLSPPLQAADGRVTVYGETRERNPSDAGGKIGWDLEIDGIRAWMDYSAGDVDAVSTAQVFGGIRIVGISDLEE